MLTSFKEGIVILTFPPALGLGSDGNNNGQPAVVARTSLPLTTGSLKSASGFSSSAASRSTDLGSGSLNGGLPPTALASERSRPFGDLFALSDATQSSSSESQSLSPYATRDMPPGNERSGNQKKTYPRD